MTPTLLSRLRRWIRPNPDRVAARLLYAALVQAARRPELFVGYGIPNSPDGRLESLIHHVALACLRLVQPDDQRGRAMGQHLFDLLFRDVEVNLTELGVGDMSLGKKVKGLMPVFNGRLLALKQALATVPEAEGCDPALAAMLARGLLPEPVPGGLHHALAAQIRATWAALQQTPREVLFSGRLPDLPLLLPPPSLRPDAEPDPATPAFPLKDPT